MDHYHFKFLGVTTVAGFLIFVGLAIMAGLAKWSLTAGLGSSPPTRSYTPTPRWVGIIPLVIGLCLVYKFRYREEDLPNIVSVYIHGGGLLAGVGLSLGTLMTLGFAIVHLAGGNPPREMGYFRGGALIAGLVLSLLIYGFIHRRRWAWNLTRILLCAFLIFIGLGITGVITTTGSIKALFLFILLGGISALLLRLLYLPAVKYWFQVSA